MTVSPSAESPVTREAVSQVKSRSLASPGGLHAMLMRMEFRDISTLPSAEISCSTSQSGARCTVRSTPESETAFTWGAYWPGRVAVNQISFPDAAHANPRPVTPRANVDLWPDLSMVVTIALNAESNSSGPSKNATRVPSGDTRSDHAALVSWTIVPTGNSMVHGRPSPGSRMTASAFVPGIQSASTTPSSRSRRAPPAIAMRASVRTPNACWMF